MCILWSEVLSVESDHYQLPQTAKITIIYYVYKHHAFNADAASLGMSAVFMCCGSKYRVSSNEISIYNFILALYLLYG